PLIRSQVVEQLLGSDRVVFEAQRASVYGEERWAIVGEQKYVRVHAVARLFAESQDAQRNPWVRRWDGDLDRRPVAHALAAGRGRVAIEHSGEEDRAPSRVKVQNLWSVWGEAEPVVDGPSRDIPRAALEDGEIERVDAGLEEYLHARRGRRRLERGIERAAPRGRLQRQPLEGPRSTLLHAGGDARQGDQRAELPAAAQKLERRDVMLHPIVVGCEGSRAAEVNGPVRAGQAGARKGRGDSRGEGRDQRDSGCDECSDVTHVVSFPWTRSASPSATETTDRCRKFPVGV